MHAPKVSTSTVQATPQSAFGAALGVVQNGKFELLGVNNEHHAIVFTQGMTGLSWGKIHLLAVVPDGVGATINVTVGGRDDAPKALLDGWKHSKAGAKFLTSVEAVLTGGANAPQQPVESFATLADGTVVPWSGKDYPGL